MNTCMNSVKTFKVWSRAFMLLTKSSKEAVSCGTGAAETERENERIREREREREERERER